MTITSTLTERGSTHGDYEADASTADALWSVMLQAQGKDAWWNLQPYQRHALTLIMVKVARILNGSAAHTDHWHDIAGYATLVEQRLLQRERENPAMPCPVDTTGCKWPLRCSTEGCRRRSELEDIGRKLQTPLGQPTETPPPHGDGLPYDVVVLNTLNGDTEVVGVVAFSTIEAEKIIMEGGKHLRISSIAARRPR